MASSSFSTSIDLQHAFAEVNERHFDGFLEVPQLRWNSRLRSSAGRFVPGRRSLFHQDPPVIEIASYLLEEENSRELVRDTLAHEMIHYWLWVRRRPYGHTPEFWDKMTVMGVSRYNPVPRNRNFRHLYACPACHKQYPARKRLSRLACGDCCKLHTRGRYDARYALVYVRGLVPSERLPVKDAPV